MTINSKSVVTRHLLPRLFCSIYLGLSSFSWVYFIIPEMILTGNDFDQMTGIPQGLHWTRVGGNQLLGKYRTNQICFVFIIY